MNDIILFLSNLVSKVFQAMMVSLVHNWKVLLFSILLAVALKTYVNSDKLNNVLMRKKKISIFASVLFGAFTPLCACGTTAVIIGMLTTTLPWGPVMAFLTSSPLMSPDGFVLISGVIGLRFAVALTAASVVIGIASGFITNVIEKRTNYLKDQSRFSSTVKKAGCSCGTKAVDTGCSCNTKAVDTNCSCNTKAVDTSCSCSTKAVDASCNCSTEVIDTGCSCVTAENADSCSCGSGLADQKRSTNFSEKPKRGWQEKLKVKEFSRNLFDLGIRQILLFYLIFVAIGNLINSFVPTSIISALFGANSFFAVPLASLIGLPLYITTDSGIPIVHSMIQSGGSEGAMLAFMITGSATSAWVIAGLATFMKKRAIALYVAFVLVGGILSGYLLDFINFIR